MLGLFTELRTWLLTPWVGHFCEIRGTAAVRPMLTLLVQNWPAESVALKLWGGSRGRNKQIPGCLLRYAVGDFFFT